MLGNIASYRYSVKLIKMLLTQIGEDISTYCTLLE